MSQTIQFRFHVTSTSVDPDVSCLWVCRREKNWYGDLYVTGTRKGVDAYLRKCHPKVESFIVFPFESKVVADNGDVVQN